MTVIYGIYDFETQAKGEAHRICNDYLARSSHPEAGYGRNGRLAQCSMACPSTLGANSFLTAVEKCGSPAWAFA